jgi:hypothetical protein
MGFDYTYALGLGHPLNDPGGAEHPLHFPYLQFNALRPSGNYEPSAVTVSNAAFCIYWFCMVLTVNSYYFLKRH